LRTLDTANAQRMADLESHLIEAIDWKLNPHKNPNDSEPAEVRAVYALGGPALRTSRAKHFSLSPRVTQTGDEDVQRVLAAIAALNRADAERARILESNIEKLIDEIAIIQFPELSTSSNSKVIVKTVTMELVPTSDNGYLNQGIVYRNQGDLDRAIMSFNQAIRLNPHHADAYFH